MHLAERTLSACFVAGLDFGQLSCVDSHTQPVFRSDERVTGSIQRGSLYPLICPKAKEAASASAKSRAMEQIGLEWERAQGAGAEDREPAAGRVAVGGRRQRRRDGQRWSHKMSVKMM